MKEFTRSLMTIAATTIVVAGLTAATSIAEEQKAAPNDGIRSDDPNVTVVAAGGFEYDIPKDVAVAAYVVKRSQGMNGATVNLRLFVRDGEEYLALPPFETVAAGNLSSARIGDAYLLVPADTQEQP